MTVREVISKVRTELRDDNSPYRWSDETLINLINDGIRIIASIRPDAKYVKQVTVQGPALVSQNTDEIGLHDNFFTALVFYVCYRCLAMDWEHGGNLNAAQNYERYFIGEIT